ncbi:complement C3 isoform X2 [Chanos chanos]|uniref:Complement C3 isoform X2 n=1 Tax=Chanos chanos TaxID=29144 RepID=A0A6J2VTL5_CHACN|nr:complement C3-like isoform X2 [Chanos chanos]
MHMDLVWLAVVSLSLPLISECTPLYIMSAPNLLRVGTPENVFVEAQDYTGGGNINVKIVVKDHPRKSEYIVSKNVVLTAANNYQLLTSIEIPNSNDLFGEDPMEKQYVYLQAQFPGSLLEKVVLISFQSGYIFIQTDKTIYTPDNAVHYRLFCVNPGLQPMTSGISVEIMTPDNIIIHKEIVFPWKGVKSGKYQLPEITSSGTWKVVTSFLSSSQKKFTADFEVKEYVLPSFEVTLKPSKSFFYIDDVELKVQIQTRYLHGNEVTGTGFVMFGVMSDVKRTLPGSLQRVEIRNGLGEAVLKKSDIEQTFPNINELVGQSIYITVSVLTETGSEMVEAQKGGIQIVTSPYTIQFKGTPKYFKPGMPFDVSIYVTNPDQSPARDIEVVAQPGGVSARTKPNGMAKLTVNSEGGSSKLDISVKTSDPRLTDARQANNHMSALAYTTKGGSQNYLHIVVHATELTVGDQFKVILLLNNRLGSQEHDLTYMILSKGQIVKVDKFKRRVQALVTLSLTVTKDMVPAFRLVAYYHVGSSEVVSDSVWVDVKDTCIGALKVEAIRARDTYSPGKPFNLKITGDPGAKVGLVAVDKGVYVLNNKNRLTQTKIWDIIEKHDTGCTAGSGKDSMGVFSDAGLLFESNTAGGTDSRTTQCPSPSKRRRRDVAIVEMTNRLADKYSGLLKQCCLDGMRENKLGYTCERRSEFIIDGDECVKAFIHCCKEMFTRKQEAKDEQMLLARSVEQDEVIGSERTKGQVPGKRVSKHTAETDKADKAFSVDSDEIISRTQFPETWLWEDELLPQCPDIKPCSTTSITKSSFLKDSITTWEITAISLSPSLGICVADPYEMVVVKDFFIDLKLPYSAVRNEQVEIKAILHNYNDYDLEKVRVELMKTENVCSSASKRGRYRTYVRVNKMSTLAVPFVIFPLELGEHYIEVKASDSKGRNTDGIRKELRVVPEGVLTKLEVKNLELNPVKHGGEQVEFIKSDPLTGRVPNTPASKYLAVRGEGISQTLEQAISGDFMGSLIVQPVGDGEQNMIHMTLPLIATHYLDNTKQWDRVGLNRRNEAIKHITTGYQRELAFCKPDGSYAAQINRKSSTWLTAYVAKVFAMASDLISNEDNAICRPLKWLILNAQLPDGRFKEDAPVIHGEMVGNVRGKDADVCLTAFVLIAMQEGSRFCGGSISALSSSMGKSISFLEHRLQDLTNPYSVAIVSCALANAGKLNKAFLMAHSTQTQDGIYWEVPGAHHFTLEATAYALLALVKANDFYKAGQVVHWLNRQQTHYGGSGTTQATIMVFQAVAEYRVQGRKQQDLNLKVDVHISAKPRPSKYTIGQSQLLRLDRLHIDQNLTLVATGTGTGPVTVLTLYYAKPVTKESDCRHFDLEVTMDKQADVSYPGAIETYQLSIEVFYKSGDRDATMSILDVGLLTGFVVDEHDLNELMTGRDRYIQKFEMDKQLSERGSLIIYLDKVSHKHRDKIVFRVHKVMDGRLQPAGITVYEYYVPDQHCVKFYLPKKKEGHRNSVCHGELCLCAEENCIRQKKDKVSEKEREDKACEPGMGYVYKATVESAELTENTDIYNMRIDQVIKEGTDAGVEGKERIFMAQPHCRDALDLLQGKTYLIMGQFTDLVRIDGRLQYLLGEKTWIEYWPTREESQTPQYRERFAGIRGLVRMFMSHGCSTRGSSTIKKENTCSLQRSERLDENKRTITACNNATDYVYRATLESSEEDASQEAYIYHMKITEVHKLSTDDHVFGKQRPFSSRSICHHVLGLEEGKSYLIMGLSNPPVLANGRYQYTLGERTWIEQWPTEEESKLSEALRESYKGMEILTENLLFGCTP